MGVGVTCVADAWLLHSCLDVLDATPEKPSFRLGPEVEQDDIIMVNESAGRGRGQEVVPFSTWNRVAESVVLIKTKG